MGHRSECYRESALVFRMKNLRFAFRWDKFWLRYVLGFPELLIDYVPKAAGNPHPLQESSRLTPF